jgi:hypothetical protein
VTALEGALATIRDSHAAEVVTLNARLTYAQVAAYQAEETTRRTQERLEQLEAEDRARRGKGALRRAWDGWRGR